MQRPIVKKPKTAEELDKEIDAFMGDGDEAPTQVTPAVVDVEM